MLSKADAKIESSKKAILATVNKGRAIDSRETFCSTIDQIGKQVYGWQKSFDMCNDNQIFKIADTKLQSIITKYNDWFMRFLKDDGVSPETKLKIQGVPSTMDLFREKNKATASPVPSQLHSNNQGCGSHKP